ncbi:MAG TPA: hypothetical protein VFE40_09735 [Jatrophihabitantaceae bacterium]|nr:hypothetical protein [Jatrophihabitantaceae bacterium]
MQLQVLVDADNVAPPRLQPVLDLLSALLSADPGRTQTRMTASGRRAALDRLSWPAGMRLLEHEGWQRADVALAEAYSPGAHPLILVTGDGDFALLAARHPGDVLVVSGAASGRLRDHALVVDPATEGTGPILAWLAAHDIT